MKKFYAILCLAIASLTQLQAQAPHVAKTGCIVTAFNLKGTIEEAIEAVTRRFKNI